MGRPNMSEPTSDENIGRLKKLIDGDGRDGDLNDHVDLIGWAVQELECRPCVDISAELRELREVANAVFPSTGGMLREIAKRISKAVSPKYVPVIGENGKPTGYHREVKTREVVTLEHDDE